MYSIDLANSAILFLTALCAAFFLSGLRYILPDLIYEKVNLESSNKGYWNLFKIYFLNKKVSLPFYACIVSGSFFYQFSPAISNEKFYLIYIYLSLTLLFIDLDSQLLPDFLTLSLLWLGIIHNLERGFIDVVIYAIVATYLLLQSINFVYFLLRKREGLGQGDVKLICAMAGWFAYPDLLTILLLAFFGHIVIVLLFKNAKKSLNDEIAFGPALIISSYLILLI